MTAAGATIEIVVKEMGAEVQGIFRDLPRTLPVHTGGLPHD